jgi:hypothetical protein
VLGVTRSEEVLKLLSLDLASFADPGGEVTIRSGDDDGYRVTWSQDGKTRRASFSIDEQSSVPWPDVVVLEGVRMSYPAFLSSANMADLRGIARNMLNVLDPIPSYVALDSILLNDLDAVAVYPNIVLSDEMITTVAGPGDGRTNVVFVTADAGVGKTSLLRHVVRQKAEEYMHGQTSALWLYVDAQGKRLAQLDEAIAAVLDDVRAKFWYHSVAALVRTGAVIVVVDGFDELIGGVGSYDEAYSSLANFISDLAGFGCIVASARSAYYEQEFLARTSSTLGYGSDSWRLTAMQLLDWSNDKRREYVEVEASRRGCRPDVIRLVVMFVDAILDHADVRDVAYKPFFVACVLDIFVPDSQSDDSQAISEATQEDDVLPGGGGLLDRLVAAYILREVEQKLISSATGRSMLDSEQYRLLLSELAEEMWRQETRELSSSSVREIVTIIGDLIGLSGDHLREVVERLPYSAFLVTGAITDSVQFGHDIFYSYFLADPVARTWRQANAGDLAQLLRRGHLPQGAATLASRLNVALDPQQLLSTLTQSIKKAHGDQEQVRQNSGALAAGLISEIHGRRALKFSDFTFGEVALVNSDLIEADIRDCRLIGTDLTRLKVRGCVAKNVSLDRVIVDPDFTRLDVDGLELSDFHGLRVRNDNGDRWVFDPQEIQRVLDGCDLPAAKQAPPFRDIDQGIVTIVDKLCRLYVRANSLTEEDDAMANVVADRNWRQIRMALLDSRVVSIETKSASGNKVFLRRNVLAEQVMLGLQPDADVPVSVKVFWNLLEINRMQS